MIFLPLYECCHLSQCLISTPSVIREIRDEQSRAALDQLRLVAQASAQSPDARRASSPLERAPPLPRGKRAGFFEEEPPAAYISRVREEARITGDLASLSAADIEILALALQYHAPTQRPSSKHAAGGARSADSAAVLGGKG